MIAYRVKYRGNVKAILGAGLKVRGRVIGGKVLGHLLGDLPRVRVLLDLVQLRPYQDHEAGLLRLPQKLDIVHQVVKGPPVCDIESNDGRLGALAVVAGDA